MSRLAILHIGTEKTGTTTLQHFLAENRATLAQHGYRYPRFCGERNHTGLVAYAADPQRLATVREPFGVRSAQDVPAMRQRMRRAAELELADNKNAIFCSEHCHSQLQSPTEVATLREMLATFFDEVKVCVYLRRQDQVALSLYSTRLKSGEVQPQLLPTTDPLDPYFNYDRLLSLWENEFGRNNIHPRLFDRSILTRGSIVPDFLEQWNLGPETDYTMSINHNGSIQPAAQEFLRHINPHLRTRGGRLSEAARGSLVTGLERTFGGRGTQPSRSAAEAFFTQYRDANEAVRTRYFPSRTTLFNDDFSNYPEQADDPEITLDEFAQVAARLHMDMQEKICKLESKIALSEARLSWAQDERIEAFAALRRALNWNPANAEVHRTLGQYMLREERIPEALAAARTATENRPCEPEYWHFLGMVLRKSGASSEAIVAQERALALDPSHAAAARQRGKLLAASSTSTEPEHLLAGKDPPNK